MKTLSHSLDELTTPPPAAALPRSGARLLAVKVPRRFCVPVFLAGIALFVALAPTCFADLPGSWAPTGNLNEARYEHRATLLNNGTVLVEGGLVEGVYTTTAEIYNPSTRTWTPTGSMNAIRQRHTATLLNDGRVLAAGGYALGAITDCDLYNPATGTWTATGSLITGRFQHGAALLTNGKVLVVGGFNTSTELASAELFDPASGTWTQTGSLATNRTEHTTTLLANGKVLVAGGRQNSRQILASAELYDPATGLWTTTGRLNNARQEHTATLLPDGRVLVAGGYGNGSTLASAELYDPATGIWTFTGDLISARAVHSAMLQPDGKVLVAGGQDRHVISSAELYDPATGAWTATGEMATARIGYTMTLLPDRTTLAAGGATNDFTLVESAEIYTPGTVESTHVSGNGAINTSTGVATFDFDVTLSNGKASGVFTFSDSNGGVIISRSRVRSLTSSGDTATIGGSARLGSGGGTVTFSATVMDNSPDGSSDTFRIKLSNGYSADGTLTSGNITIQ